MLRHAKQQVSLRTPCAVLLMSVVESEYATLLIVSIEVLIECHANGSNSLIVAAFLSSISCRFLNGFINNFIVFFLVLGSECFTNS